MVIPDGTPERRAMPCKRMWWPSGGYACPVHDAFFKPGRRRLRCEGTKEPAPPGRPWVRNPNPGHGRGQHTAEIARRAGPGLHK